MASAVLLTGLLAAGSASAQTTNADGSEIIYTGTLTPATTNVHTESLGFYKLGNELIQGTLSPETFTYDGNTYRITRLLTNPGGGGTGELSLGDTVARSLNTADSIARWVLHLDSDTFAFADADDKLIGSTFTEWYNVTNASLGWSAGQTVAVKIVRRNEPTAPTNLTASTATSTQIDLSWSPPSETGGSDITGYRIEVSTDGGMNWTDLVADTSSIDTMYSDSSLTTSCNLRTYRVSAINAIGTGPASSPASAAARAGPPGAPVVPSGHRELWSSTLTVAEHAGEVGVRLVTGSSYGSLSSATFTYGGVVRNVTGLFVGGLGLTFGIRPKLDDFTHHETLNIGSEQFAFSDAVFADTITRVWTGSAPSWCPGDTITVKLTTTAPGAPRNLAAKATSSTQIDLDWDPPTNAGASAIRGYWIEVSTDSGSTWTVLRSDTGSTDTTYSHTGLALSATRHYRVSAINSGGNGAGSNTASATVTAPGTPGNLQATVGNTEVTLAWNAAPDNGSNSITKYQVRHEQGSSVSPGVAWTDVAGGDGARTHTVTGLTTGTEYTFEVRAVNGVGDGAAATVTQTTVLPTWELTLTDSNGINVTHLTEGGASATVTVRITNGVTFSTAQTVTLEWDGLALDTINRIRGAGGASAITIPPGQSSGTLVISAPDPGGVATYAPPRTAPLRGMHGANPIGGIDLTLRDDDEPPVATLTANPSQVSEGGTIEVEISLNPAFGAHATSTLKLVVTDADGALVAPLPSEVEFDSGELTHALALTAADNAVEDDGAREVTVALVANPDASPYTLGEPSSVTVTVLDNDTSPSEPLDLTAEPGDGRVRLRWTAPATDNGQAVTGYEYRQKSGTGSFDAWTDITGSNVNTTEHTVDGLTNGILYTFEVRAENRAGRSASSNQASTTPGAGDTTAPMLQGATTTALALGLTYDENLDADSEPAPSAFTVTVNGASRSVTEVSLEDEKVVLTLASAVRAGDLVRVSYTVPANNPLRDEASNPAGSFSDHLVTNATPATVPDAPTDLTATPGDESVTLRWTAPAHDGGSEVTGHQYCREEGTSASCTAESDWRDIAASAPGGANATGYTVTDLTNGTGYTFRVRARNAEGESAPSPEAGTTPDGADTASPEVVRALSAGFGRMVGSQALRMVSAHLEGGGGTQVTVGGERLGGSATASLGRLEAAARDGDEGRPRTRTGREALLGSSFRLQSGGEETGAAAWGGMAAGRFETRSDGVATEGEVTTGMVGADVTSGRWLVGGALSHARGKGSFATSAERAEGEAETRLTALHPYARVRLGERMSAWGLAGYGKGELTVTGAGGKRVATGLRMRMGAVGARGTVVPAPAGGGFELALKTDALWMRVRSEAAEGLPGVRADARRLRLVLDASRVVKTAGGATLTPRLEAGVRRDGGDTERGTGLEVGAGLRYARSAVTVEGAVRALVAHEDAHYREWGASGAIRVEPGTAGRGLSLGIVPTWGAAASGAERLWSARDAGGLVRSDDFEAERRIEVELGYGLGAPHGPGLVTPYAGVTLSGGAHRALRTGLRWNASPSATVSLEARREGQGAGEATTNALTLRAEARW